jgi:hypothetical protein
MADWVTTAEVKLYAGVPTADTAKDTLIAANIPRAQAMIEQYILKSGQVYGTFTDVVEYLSPVNLTKSIFSRLHTFITTLSYVKEDGIELIADDDYVVELDMGRIERQGGNWMAGANKVEIKYSCTNPVPEDIKLALLEYVSVLSRIKSTTFITAEGVEKTAEQGIPSFITDLLNGRKILRCAMG